MLSNTYYYSCYDVLLLGEIDSITIMVSEPNNFPSVWNALLFP